MKHSPKNPQSEESGDEDSGFFNRWSKRKRSAEAPVVTDNEVLDDIAPTSELSATEVDATSLLEAEQTDAPVLTDVDMPDIETLHADSDFSPFLSEGVSKELRNLALKKLFFSGKFSARDGLDDYDDDFTYFEPLGDTVTSDMKFHERRKEKARLAELEAKEAEEAEALAEQESSEEAEQSDIEKTEENQPVEVEEPDSIVHANADIDDADNKPEEHAIEEEAEHPLG